MKRYQASRLIANAARVSQTMHPPDMRIGSLADDPGLQQQMETLTDRAWPPFLYHAPLPGKYWNTIHATFPEFQRLFFDGDRLIACANMVPLRYDGAFEDLPPGGLEWGQTAAVEGAGSGLVPNVAMGFQIVIAPQYRGGGISPLAVVEMKRVAAAAGLTHVILPVRPVWKERHPEIPMQDYIGWHRADGLPVDPWLRVHIRLGARMVGPCPASTIVPGRLADWREWTGLTFPVTGRYPIPGGLDLLNVDLEADHGVYTEPNVWMVHEARS